MIPARKTAAGDSSGQLADIEGPLDQQRALEPENGDARAGAARVAEPSGSTLDRCPAVAPKPTFLSTTFKCISPATNRLRSSRKITGRRRSWPGDVDLTLAGAG
jgi:hypothetical protein